MYALIVLDNDNLPYLRANKHCLNLHPLLSVHNNLSSFHFKTLNTELVCNCVEIYLLLRLYIYTRRETKTTKKTTKKQPQKKISNYYCPYTKYGTCTCTVANSTDSSSIKNLFFIIFFLSLHSTGTVLPTRYYNIIIPV